MISLCWWHFFHSGPCCQLETKTATQLLPRCLKFASPVCPCSVPYGRAARGSLWRGCRSSGGPEPGAGRFFSPPHGLCQLPSPPGAGPGGRALRAGAAGAQGGCARRGGRSRPRCPSPLPAARLRRVAAPLSISLTSLRTPCASSTIPPPPPGVSASLRAGSAAGTAAAAAAGRMRGRRGAGQR